MELIEGTKATIRLAPPALNTAGDENEVVCASSEGNPVVGRASCVGGWQRPLLLHPWKPQRRAPDAQARLGNQSAS
jgi:hypothetical protein